MNEGGSIMDGLGPAITTALGFITKVVEFILGNPLLIVMFAAGVMIPLAIKIFKKIKASVKR